MTDTHNVQSARPTAGVSRRNIIKGAAWAAPAIVVAGAAPAYADSTLLPCIGRIGAVGGTYPVTTSLSGCGDANSHWDFNFEISAAISDPNCACGTNGEKPTHLRITMYDNPKRSRLWILGGDLNPDPDWTGSTDAFPRLYVQKVLPVGTSATFPAEGDEVYRVAGSSPYAGWATGGSHVGTVQARGQANDSVHVIFNPSGGAPACTAQGPMAYYTVECSSTGKNGPWKSVGDPNVRGEINPCVPMIQASVCRSDTTGNDRFKLTITPLNTCGIDTSKFKITNVQRNGSSDYPTSGGSVWTGSQAVGSGITIETTANSQSGSNLWISFTTDNGANTSMIRVDTTSVSCPQALQRDAAAPAEQAPTEPAPAEPAPAEPAPTEPAPAEQAPTVAQPDKEG